MQFISQVLWLCINNVCHSLTEGLSLWRYTGAPPGVRLRKCSKLNLSSSQASLCAFSPHYANINFQSCSVKAGGEVLKPSSSACACLEFSKCSTSPTAFPSAKTTKENVFLITAHCHKMRFKVNTVKQEILFILRVHNRVGQK